MGQLNVLRKKADSYTHLVYGLSRKLPVDEKFGLISQIRRAALSVPLNIIEGYSRQSIKSETQFLLVSFGSLKETQYLLEFAMIENYLSPQETAQTLELGEELARMLWTKIQRFKAQSSVAA